MPRIWTQLVGSGSKGITVRASVRGCIAWLTLDDDAVDGEPGVVTDALTEVLRAWPHAVRAQPVSWS